MTQRAIPVNVADAEKILALLRGFSAVLKDSFPQRLSDTLKQHQDDPHVVFEPLRYEPPTGPVYVAEVVDELCGRLQEGIDEDLRSLLSASPSNEWRDAFAILQAFTQDGGGSELTKTVIRQSLEDHEAESLLGALAGVADGLVKLTASLTAWSEDELLREYLKVMESGMGKADEIMKQPLEDDDDDEAGDHE